MRETIFQRESSAAMRAAINRQGRPLRTVPQRKPEPVRSPSRAEIRRWMVANQADYIDPKTGELNWTALVEAWDRSCADGGATLDPDHIAWEIAVSLDVKSK